MWRVYYGVLTVLSPAARIVFYWHNKLRTVRRVRVVVMRPSGDVLLVKNSLGDRKWSLPGGGAGRNESDVMAACREVFEELHIRMVPKELESLGVVTMNGYVMPLFIAHIDQVRADAVIAQRTEIRAWRWVDPAHMPENAQKIVSCLGGRLSTDVKIDRIE